jgi:hypothetical protein
VNPNQQSTGSITQWLFLVVIFLAIAYWLSSEDYGSLQRALASAPAAPPNLEESLKKAQCDGKYAMLLHQFKAEKEADEYGEFKDLGFRNRKKYAGQDDLSAGWWVYVQPYWYIWGDRTDRAKKAKRNYGPEQLIGEPDVPAGGSSSNAWCPRTTDAPEEWLMLEYETLVKPVAILIYENSVPGGVVKVSAFKVDGTEVVVWKGDDPIGGNVVNGVSEIECKADFKTDRIKIYIDSKNLPGWHEIDAVGLRDDKEKTHWVAHAVASSTYAGEDPSVDRVEHEERISNLEEEVQVLKKAMEQMKKQINKKEN